MKTRLHVLRVVVQVEVALPELAEAITHALERVTDARVVRERQKRVRQPHWRLGAQPNLRRGHTFTLQAPACEAAQRRSG